MGRSDRERRGRLRGWEGWESPGRMVLDRSAEWDLGQEERRHQTQQGEQRRQQERALDAGREADPDGGQDLVRYGGWQLAKSVRQSLALSGDQSLRSIGGSAGEPCSAPRG